MFTGIIEAVGRVRRLQRKGADLILSVNAGRMSMVDVRLGDSIAVNGVCLTVTALQSDGFEADVSAETLRHTRLSSLKVGDSVNLEKALQLSDRLGGHLVSGHVDGLADVVERYDDGRAVRFVLRCPPDLSRYIANKGSVTIDGTSLTVNQVDGDRFWLNIVPHTATQTIMMDYRVGTQVHLEVDLLARYLERLLNTSAPASQSCASGVTTDLLARSGFLR